MVVTAFDGVAWLRTEPDTGTLRLGGLLDDHTGLELIPALVVALHDDVPWRVLNLEELTSLSASGDRLVRGVVRLAAARGEPLHVVYPARTLDAVDAEPAGVVQRRSV